MEKGPLGNQEEEHREREVEKRVVCEGMVSSVLTLHKELTLSKDRKSYSLSCFDSIPAAKMRPSGSNEATGLPPLRCIKPCDKNSVTYTHTSTAHTVLLHTHFHQ